MTNKIGEKIKTLRKKANVTQEKFAEYLGITFQAISRWESGICYPDLEIIPAIANYFNVTTDELLGVDIMNKEERLREISEKLAENQSKGLIDENIEICRNAINEFPNEFSLLNKLSFYLMVRYNTKESISIDERILADCTDDHIRYSVMQRLAYSYKTIGEKDKAIEVARKLPSTPVTCDMILEALYDGEERVEQLRKNIISFCDYITRDMSRFLWAKYSDTGNEKDVQTRIKTYQKAIDIYKIIYEDGDYGFYNTRMAGLHLAMASNYILLNDYDNVLDCIEKSAEYTIAFDMLPEVFTHTSIIPDGYEFTKAQQLSKHYNYNDSYEMLNMDLCNERYNPIRDTERFKAVLAKLEQYAEKET